MKKRVMVAVVGIPFLLLVLAWAPDWATALLVAAMCAVGAYELMRAVTGERKDWFLLLLPSVLGASLNLWIYAGWGEPWLVWFAFLAALFLYSILHYGGEETVLFSDMTAALFAGIVFPLMLSCLLRLRMTDYGVIFVFVPLAISFGSDTFALFAGLFCGKHKLAPHVSPKKTVEGSIGGLLGAVFGLLLVKWIAYGLAGVVFLTYWQALLFGILGSVISQIGDLSFSVIKREYGIKDYGKLLPGHGGILDRFDSVAFVSPFVWLLFRIL